MQLGNKLKQNASKPKTGILYTLLGVPTIATEQVETDFKCDMVCSCVSNNSLSTLSELGIQSICNQENSLKSCTNITPSLIQTARSSRQRILNDRYSVVGTTVHHKVN